VSDNSNHIIRDLRIKFVVAMVSLCGVMILAIFCGVGFNDYYSRVGDLERALYTSVQETRATSIFVNTDAAMLGYLSLPWYNGMRDETPLDQKRSQSSDEETKETASSNTMTVPEIGGESASSSNYLPVIVYKYAPATGEYTPIVEGATVPTGTLESISEEVAHANWGLNRNSANNLYYYKIDTQHGIRVAFTSTSFVDDYIGGLVKSFSIAFIISMCSLLVISYILSNILLTPVKQAWESQRRFVSDASHELRTPISIILANLEVIESDKDATVEEVSKWIDTAKNEIDCMNELVNDMLFLAQNNEPQPVIGPAETTNISKMATRLANSLDAVAYEHGMSIETDIEKNCFVPGTEKQIHRIISVLLDNAIKYADENTVIDVGVKSLPRKVSLTVRDFGAVIPQNDIEHVFDRFYRSDTARSHHSGYGLGLSMAYEIVETINGTMSVSSSKENGTVFTVMLPKGKELKKAVE